MLVLYYFRAHADPTLSFAQGSFPRSFLRLRIHVSIHSRRHLYRISSSVLPLSTNIFLHLSHVLDFLFLASTTL